MDTRVIQLRQRPAISPDDERGHLHRGAMTIVQTTCILRMLAMATSELFWGGYGFFGIDYPKQKPNLPRPVRRT